WASPTAPARRPRRSTAPRSSCLEAPRPASNPLLAPKTRHDIRTDRPVVQQIAGGARGGRRPRGARPGLRCAAMDWSDSPLWLAIGLTGNAAFFARFLVQWVASERAGRSYVPVAFWYLSIAGSLVLLAYAIHRRDPVFTLAFLPNCVVYVRNLVLLRRTGARETPSEL